MSKRRRSHYETCSSVSLSLLCQIPSTVGLEWGLSSRLINRNIIAGHGRTSMRFEPEIWDASQEICLRERIGMGELIRRVEREKHMGGRTSAVRVHVLTYFR